MQTVVRPVQNGCGGVPFESFKKNYVYHACLEMSDEMVCSIAAQPYPKPEQPRYRRRNDASNYLKKLARTTGIEPPTTSLEGWGSLPLS